MANCQKCGRDAGYLNSICPSCKEGVVQNPGPVVQRHAAGSSDRPLVLPGKQGKTLYVSGDSIRIEKTGGFFAEKREKTLPIRQITSVEVKKPSTFVGFIQFSIAGGKAHDSSYTITGGAFDAVSDENAVTFLGDEHYKIALQIKEYIEQWAARQGAPPSPSPTSAADEILKLAGLLDRGLLTRDEFDAKKKQLLGL